jgi:Spy/CpxP family protein refolding chaperone
MRKIGMTVLMSLLIVGLASAAFSWGGGPGNCGRGPGYGPAAGGGMGPFAKLNLTPEQTEKISTMQQAQFKETKPLRDKIFAKRGDLKLLWLEKNPDQEKILATQKELRSLRDQMQDKMTVHRLAVLKILTPEQQSKMQSYMGRGMGPGMGHGMGFRSGMGSGPGGCPQGNCR